MAFEAFLLNLLANVASDTVGATVKLLFEKIMEFKHGRDNYHHFRDMLNVMKGHLNEIRSSSSQHHAKVSPAVETCIKALISILRDAESLIPEAPPSLSWFRRATIHISIEDVKRRLEAGFKQLDSILERQDRMNKMALLRAPVLLIQPEQQTGFIGDVIKDPEERILKLQFHQDNPAQIIVVYGMGGVTTLLHKVYSSEVRRLMFFFVGEWYIEWKLFEEHCWQETPTHSYSAGRCSQTPRVVVSATHSMILFANKRINEIEGIQEVENGEKNL